MSDLRHHALRIAASLPAGDSTRRRILEALARTAYDRGVHVAVRDLPPGIQKALKSMRYGRKDILVQADARPQMTDFGGDGRKAFFVAVDILSGRTVDSYQGSWGGPNMFRSQPLDEPDRFYNLRSGIAAIHGSRGGKMFASIAYHPSDKDSFVPEEDDVDLSSDERKALNVLGYKSGYRKDEWWRAGLPGEYGVRNPLVQGLVAKGLIKTNRAGAISLTPKGRNAR